jgi:hypothetical protein
MHYPLTEVVAFVDWNSQLHHARAKDFTDPTQPAKLALEQCSRWIGQTLIDIDRKRRYRVRQRLYHGWHAGLTQAPNRRAIERVLTLDFRLASTWGQVVFELPIEYGDRLLDALPHRQRSRNPLVHLPDTYRSNCETQKMEEKMVDTALATDLLAHSRRAPKDWRLVLAEDDDLIPPLFTAEAWSKGRGGKTLLLRHRTAHNPHICLDGLLVAPTEP